MSEKWLDQFTEILDQIALFKQQKVKNSYAPFIDKELKHKMLQRDLYKKRHTKHRDPDDWLRYKQLRNEVNFEMKAKKNLISVKSSKKIVETLRKPRKFSIQPWGVSQKPPL